MSGAGDVIPEPSDAEKAEITLDCGGTFHFFDAWLSTRADLANAGSGRQLDAFHRVPQYNRSVVFWWGTMKVVRALGWPSVLGWTYRRWSAARDANIVSRFGSAALASRGAR